MARRLDRCGHDRDFFRNREMGARALSRERGGGVCLWRRELAHYVAALDLLFIADPSFRRGVHPGLCEPGRPPRRTERARRPDRDERSRADASEKAVTEELRWSPIEIAVAGEGGLRKIASVRGFGSVFGFGLGPDFVFAAFMMFFREQHVERRDN